MRCFIALELFPEVQREIVQAQKNLKTCGADVKWVEEENLHLTLYFLGEITPVEMEKGAAALQEVCSSFPPFEVTLGEWGAFPHLRRPRVLWVGIKKGREPLFVFYQKLGEAFQNQGFKLEEKFSPHITLGRVRSPRNLASLVSLFSALLPLEVGQRVEVISLMESKLTRSGPLYFPRLRVPLTKEECSLPLTP